MVFNSVPFLAFLPLVLAVYWLLHDRVRQNVWLLVASYVFYAWFDWRFLGLMVATTLVDFWVGARLESLDTDEAKRRRLFLVSVTSNLVVLGTFKYLGFFADSVQEGLEAVGLKADVPTLQLLLPIGISFYTFHGISYTCDVYRRRIPAASSLTTFACFVAYFPQLVAGPIGRAEVQLPQFERPRTPPRAAVVREALTLVLLGFVKKLVVADVLAAYVIEVFQHPGETTAVDAYLAAIAFALQIYGDFSGYTDIARGVSRLFGIELPLNFAQPYFSRSITEFWQRWHISLSSWLRDYLYIPLGGNRRGPGRTYVNLMTTMVLGGLWHGASWTFVAWGAFHGAALAGHRFVTGRRPGVQPDDPVLLRRDWWRILLTFHVVLVGWVLFRADSLGQAGAVLRAVLRPMRGVDENLVLLVAAGVALVVWLDVLQRGHGLTRVVAAVSPRAVPLVVPTLRGLGAGLATAAFVVTAGGPAVQFIYFQF